MTIFHKQLVLIGQYNPARTLACNETSLYNKFVDPKLILKNLTPKVRKLGYEKTSTSPGEEKRAKKLVTKVLENAINLHVKTKETPENLKAYTCQGYIAGYPECKKLGINTGTNKKLNRIIGKKN